LSPIVTNVPIAFAAKTAGKFDAEAVQAESGFVDDAAVNACKNIRRTAYLFIRQDLRSGAAA
jgi:transposase